MVQIKIPSIYDYWDVDLDGDRIVIKKNNSPVGAYYALNPQLPPWMDSEIVKEVEKLSEKYKETLPIKLDIEGRIYNYDNYCNLITLAVPGRMSCDKTVVDINNAIKKGIVGRPVLIKIETK